MRIGLDVGGTNTDAALMDGSRLVAQAKRPGAGRHLRHNGRA